ncbi:MAG: aminopeptidase P family N-terminal domain-containing protein, partial [Paraburkholderia sp.]|uniref:aminopeptidase P family N-terminal domain-containing protein n=1 Tax=Paraburkholderia sp. TaxID=1926495 RepID=UPI003C48E827
MEKLRDLMVQKGLDHLIVPAPENMFYLTGYDGWAFYLHQCIIVSRTTEHVLWIGRGSDLSVATACGVIGEGNAFAYPDTHLHSNKLHPYDYVAQIMATRGLSSGVLGVAMDAYHFTPAAYLALVKALSECRVVSDDLIVNWQRVVKSSDEHMLMQEAARIGAAALLAGVSAIEAGSPISATASEILRYQTGAPTKSDGGYPAIMPLLIDGVGPARPHDT